MSKPVVLIAEELSPATIEALGPDFDVRHCDGSDRAVLLAALPEAEAVLIRSATTMDAEAVAVAKNLKVIARAGVGLDNVDVPACRARGIAVLSTPDANTRAVVEYVTALTLDALRPRPSLPEALPVKEWKLLRERSIAPRQLSDLTLGILGLGKIGTQMARVGAAFNMRVIYHDLLAIPEGSRAGAAPVSRDELLGQADVLTIHVDGRKENRGYAGAEFFARCRPDMFLINTSRGFVIDAGLLAAFLRAHPLAAAALDVHEPEPFDERYPLLGLPNARLTAHLASATKTAHRNMSWVVRDLWEVVKET